MSLEQGLLLAVRLWGRMPAERVAQCALLPAGAPPPPADFFTRTTRDGERDASEAAAAFFSTGHLQVCALRAARVCSRAWRERSRVCSQILLQAPPAHPCAYARLVCGTNVLHVHSMCNDTCAQDTAHALCVLFNFEYQQITS